MYSLWSFSSFSTFPPLGVVLKPPKPPTAREENPAGQLLFFSPELVMTILTSLLLLMTFACAHGFVKDLKNPLVI